MLCVENFSFIHIFYYFLQPVTTVLRYLLVLGSQGDGAGPRLGGGYGQAGIEFGPACLSVVTLSDDMLSS